MYKNGVEAGFSFAGRRGFRNLHTQFMVERRYFGLLLKPRGFTQRRFENLRAGNPYEAEGAQRKHKLFHTFQFFKKLIER
ncbi:MAG: hypothetical protein K2I66_01505 [Bacteroidales bacterium]|nr:hypothetical protein [Bacteroidales bacterium]